MSEQRSDGATADAGDLATRRARKAALRRAARAARDELTPAERAAGSVAAVTRLARLPELRNAEVVAAYVAHGTEVDVSALVTELRRRGVTTALPRVEGRRVALVAAEAATPLVVGYRGVDEPIGPAVHLAEVDAVIVPGTAFDPNGGRVGQGGGHYDRLLAALAPDAVRIGVGFACQVVPRVPREAHDEPVDIVVTDRATYRTHAR